MWVKCTATDKKLIFNFAKLTIEEKILVLEEMEIRNEQHITFGVLKKWMTPKLAKYERLMPFLEEDGTLYAIPVNEKKERIAKPIRLADDVRVYWLRTDLDEVKK